MRWLCIALLAGGCASGSPPPQGLTAPGIEIDPISTFTPKLVLIYRDENLVPSQFGQYDQWDVLMTDDGGPLDASTLIHWNYGAPQVGVTYHPVQLPMNFTDQVPSIDALNTRQGHYALISGTVTYTQLGHDAGELASVVFDLEYEGGRRLKGRVAEPLKVMVNGP
jgi:hypothetical protein